MNFEGLGSVNRTPSTLRVADQEANLCYDLSLLLSLRIAYYVYIVQHHFLISFKSICLGLFVLWLVQGL